MTEEPAVSPFGHMTDPRQFRHALAAGVDAVPADRPFTPGTAVLPPTAMRVGAMAAIVEQHTSALPREWSQAMGLEPGPAPLLWE